MRSRVAVAAALVTLIALVLIPVVSITNMMQLRNSSTLEEIDGIVRMAGSLLENISDDEIAEICAGLSIPKAVSFGVYSTDGSTIYVTDSSIDPLPTTLAQSASAGNVVKGRGIDNQKEAKLYAIYQLDDGVSLLMCSREWTFGMILQSQRGTLAVVLVIIAASIVFFLAWQVISRKEHDIRRIMTTLDEFSEGDYSARIVPMDGDDPEILQYNAVIDRLQTRIFQQRDRNRALSTIMNQMQTGIIAVDQDMKVILVTPVAKKLLSITGHVEGMDVREISRDVHLEEVFSEAMEQSGVYTNEVAARQAVGRGHRPLRLYVSPMRGNGRKVGALALVEDISEMKRLEQVRTDFAANVSHELKTPLTSIRGFVETLQAGAIENPEMARKFLHIIDLETSRLTRLINDILSITKMESGNDEVTLERIRMDKAAYDVCEILSLQAKEKQIALNYHLNDKPICIMGNKDRVQQMLINLVENAIKYNQPGGSVTVQVFGTDETANITVSDTGIGIAEEDMPRLFERFYRVDKGRSRQMGGTGLGLAIVKHIIRSMNGEIEVHSRLGEGTEFLISLPMAPKDDPNKDTIFNSDED